MAHPGHELLNAPRIDKSLVVWFRQHVEKVAHTEVLQKHQVKFHLLKFQMKQDLHLQDVGEAAFDVAHQPLVRPGPVSLVSLGRLRSQLWVTDRQDHIQEILVVETALEGAVKEFDHVVAFKLGHGGAAATVIEHKLDDIPAVDHALIRTIYSGKARIGFELIQTCQCLSLPLYVLLLVGDQQQYLTKFGFDLAAQQVEVISAVLGVGFEFVWTEINEGSRVFCSGTSVRTFDGPGLRSALVATAVVENDRTEVDVGSNPLARQRLGRAASVLKAV